MSGPAGTFTFVFTDIEGSTRLLRDLGADYAAVLAQHDAIIRGAAQAFEGRAFGSEGDAQFLVFGDAGRALSACVEAQRALAAHDWPAGHPVRVRMGVHSGEATQTGDTYGGLVLHATARIAAAGHGGQVLVSPATRELAAHALPAGTTLRDLGAFRFKDFEEPISVYQLDVAGGPSEFPRLRARPASVAHLPTQLTDFISRAEVASVREALRAHRIVTLTGPGGAGKTRLALEAAATVVDDYADGTYFVALEGVRDAELVASEMAAVLGLTGGTDEPSGRLIAHLSDRSILLLLDNMEQVISAAGSVARLVRACEGLSILVTSRIPLRIYGEQEIPVPALSLPSAGVRPGPAAALESEAVQLFVARASAVRPGFSVDRHNVATIVDITRRLDGLPLAIELAAARLRSMPLETLLHRLDDRLGTLTGGARDLPGRQQTLRSTIEWSHGLLEVPERRLFARLGVIVGSVTLAQIEQICGTADEIGRDPFETLESLHQQSLLTMLDEAGAEPRYGMLATIREYAREQLAANGEADVLHLRHAEAYLALAEDAAPALLSADGRSWNERLEADHDDLRAALDWITAEGRVELGLRMLAALWRFWQVRGHLFEGQLRAERILSLPDVPAQAPELVARAEAAAGGIAYWRADIAATHRHYAEALRWARQSDDPAVVAEAAYNLGFAPAAEMSSQKDRYRQGRPLFEEALGLYRELGDRAGVASALWALHQSAAAEGDLVAAERLGRETLQIARELGDPFRIGWAAFTLGLEILSDRRAEAVSLFAESLEIFVGARDTSGVLLNLASIATTAMDGDSEDDGWLLLGAAHRIKDETGLDLLDDAVDYLPNSFPTPETPRQHGLVEQGRTIRMDEAIDLARRLLSSA